jgi:DNA polymerase-1
MNENILIIDAYNLFTRHYIANPAMSSNGSQAGGIVGFLRTIQNVSEWVTPRKIIVVWEGGGSTKKRYLFKDYKARRRPQKLNRFYENDIPDTVENRNWQIVSIINILKNLPINQVYVENCEADDVIGYLCKYTFRDDKKIILSSDKDFYQLIDENTRIFSPTSKKFIDREYVLKRFGISSRNFCIAKAISGDPSDNIPGIKGAGFSTLAKRYPRLASNEEDVLISEVIEETKELYEQKKLKIYDRILEGSDVIQRNWKLMYLDTNNLSASQIKKIEYQLENSNISRNKIEMIKIVNKLGLKPYDAINTFNTINKFIRE